MGRAAVRVIARTRPTDSLQRRNIQILDDGRTINVHTVRAQVETINNTVEDHTFKLDLVLKDASQEYVFEMSASEVIRSVISGYNGTVMCYGQTGSGKSYTMIGGSDYSSRGIIPRSIKAVFDEVSSQPDKLFDISVSFVEVYNERINDLLDLSSKEDYVVQEDTKGNIVIRGALVRPCPREEAALAALFEGNMNCTVSNHSLNAKSSRSHCIFTIYVNSRSRVESDSASVVSKLHLVDLAGSESISKTLSTGDTATEALYINKSLTFLEHVVMALGSSNRSHVPFRQSKLTSLLKDSLGGNSKTTMIANIWPEDRHVEETLRTLRFASRMMKVQTEATVNFILDPAAQVKQLQRTITDLKSELQMQNQLMGKSHISYEGAFTEDERFEMEKTVQAYLSDDSVSEIPVRSLREVKEYFKVFKSFIEQKAVEQGRNNSVLFDIKTCMKASPTGTNVKNGSIIPPIGTAGVTMSSTSGIGIIDRNVGISVGVAAPCKNIKDMLKTSPKAESQVSLPKTLCNRTLQQKMTDATIDNSQRRDSFLLNSPEDAEITQHTSAVVPDKAVVFNDYKRMAGAKAVEKIKSDKVTLNDLKVQAVAVGREVNEIKASIDILTAQIDTRNENDVKDDAELMTNIDKLNELKDRYRNRYESLMRAREERDTLVKVIEASLQQLLHDFEQWYNMIFNTNVNRAGSMGKPTGKDQGLDDNLDEGECFDMLQMARIRDKDPDAVAYYTAKKSVKKKVGKR
eukprot:Tbor_TRINITY_DN3383_c0_g1::TRINITY_DN3383_c0_g1_i1::g.23497::m.23497/K10397/KIF6_9; kinesin family member 6/9